MTDHNTAVEAEQTEVEADTVVTTRNDDGSLEYNPAPKFAFEVGEKVLGEGTVDVWLSGELQSVEIEKAVVVNRAREFVVDEGAWYIEYEVRYIDKYGGESIKTDRLSQSDLTDG